METLDIEEWMNEWVAGKSTEPKQDIYSTLPIYSFKHGGPPTDYSNKEEFLYGLMLTAATGIESYSYIFAYSEFTTCKNYHKAYEFVR